MINLNSFITVFYDKRPSKAVKVGENCCWESALFEVMARDHDNRNTHKKGFYKKNDEYKVLILIALVLIVMLSAVLFFVGHMTSIIRIILLLICVFYIIFSICMFYAVPKYTSSKGDRGMRIRHLKMFFQYSLDTGHYTPEEIRERFGEIYEICQRWQRNNAAQQ